MEQMPLMVTDIFDALGDIVRALGGPKKVATQLKPDRPSDEGARWIKGCLNRERRERFDPEQMVWLLARGREVGCHGAIHYICEQAGYSKPAPVNPEDEKAKLQREVVEAARTLERSIDRLERLTQPPLQAVSGGKG
jgi:hypothetical protein